MGGGVLRGKGFRGFQRKASFKGWVIIGDKNGFVHALVRTMRTNSGDTQPCFEVVELESDGSSGGEFAWLWSFIPDP